MRRTIAFATLGCRLNQVDSQELMGAFEAGGFTIVPFEDSADVVVVNTCTVTSRADVSDRQMIHRAGRQHPGARVVVTGCWAQTDPDAAARVPGIDLVVGNADKHRLPTLVEDLLSTPSTGGVEVHVSDVGQARTIPVMPFGRVHGRSRAFVKVQDGCQHRCAFCIVPFARGGSRSQAPEVVVEQVRGLAEAGYRDVTLTGVDLGHYGWDLSPRRTLAGLLREVVEVAALRWVRLSSILPAYVTPELVDLLAGSPVMAPHLHVPLQSGSDRILRRMRRPYTSGMYRRLVERLVAAIPGLSLGADVIVGFPGETEADFDATAALVQDLPFTALHVFAYSDRKGTEAARLDERVPPRVATARSRHLRALAAGKSFAFRRGMVGTTQDVWVLEARARVGGRLIGLTGNYVEVAFDGPDTLQRRLARVRVIAAGPTTTHGALA